MKILLDTHAWLWMQAQPERLNERARDLIGDPASELFLSAASVWEITIKYALGRLALSSPPVEYLPSRMHASDTLALPISHEHALHVGTLPRHHRDPFDRMLVAQARVEQLPILTADPQFDRYDVEVIRA